MLPISIRDISAASYPVDAAYSPDGRWLAWCCSGGEWGVVDVSDGQAVVRERAGDAARRVRFSPDGRHLAVATAGRLVLCMIDRWSAVVAVETGQNGGALGFTPDSSTAIVFGSGHVPGGMAHARETFAAGRAPRFVNGTVVFVSVAEARVTAVTDPRLPRTGIARQNFTALAISPDGQRIAWGESTALSVADANTGELFWTTTAHPSGVGVVAFSPDGRTLASTDYAQIALWDVSTGERRQLIRPEAGVRELAFTLDGEAIIGVATSDRLDLWWTADGSLRERIVAPGAQGQAIAVSPDGRAVAFGRFGEGGPPSIGIVGARSGTSPVAVSLPTLLGEVPLANRAMAERVDALNTSAQLRSGPPTIDLARFAAFAPLARIAVRLHPRRAQHVDAASSHVGGPILWQDNEQWPICPEHGWPMVVVAQLRAIDVPELPFPPDTDLCQVFWCELRHGEGYAPRSEVVWLSATGQPRENDLPRQAGDFSPAWRPVACVVTPERVIDYPSDYDLTGTISEAFADIEAAHPELADYAWSLGAASGFKVGGHPSWVQDPEYPTCPHCGRQMDLFLQADTSEATSGRWQPIEEANEPPLDWPLRALRRQPTVPMGFRDGKAFLFACFDCDPNGLTTVWQS